MPQAVPIVPLLLPCVELDHENKQRGLDVNRPDGPGRKPKDGGRSKKEKKDNDDRFEATIVVTQDGRPQEYKVPEYPRLYGQFRRTGTALIKKATQLAIQFCAPIQILMKCPQTGSWVEFSSIENRGEFQRQADAAREEGKMRTYTPDVLRDIQFGNSVKARGADRLMIGDELAASVVEDMIAFGLRPPEGETREQFEARMEITRLKKQRTDRGRANEQIKKIQSQFVKPSGSAIGAAKMSHKTGQVSKVVRGKGTKVSALEYHTTTLMERKLDAEFREFKMSITRQTVTTDVTTLEPKGGYTLQDLPLTNAAASLNALGSFGSIQARDVPPLNYDNSFIKRLMGAPNLDFDAPPPPPTYETVNWEAPTDMFSLAASNTLYDMSDVPVFDPWQSVVTTPDKPTISNSNNEDASAFYDDYGLQSMMPTFSV